uniref:Uncharacterized protein n=1 Tax=Anguilla anguilla TaxID=7936 RepID=A0A0E9RP51_ANGAN
MHNFKVKQYRNLGKCMLSIHVLGLSTIDTSILNVSDHKNIFLFKKA